MYKPEISASELGLNFDLSKEFCTAVWNALDDPIEAVIAATGQKYEGQNRVHLHVTPPLRSVFSDIIWRASREKAAEIGQSVPPELHDHHKQALLIAQCINYNHGAIAHIYDPMPPLALFDRAAPK